MADGVPVYVGDGAYIGDGGAALQRLWDLAPWRELRNCPGRYVSKKKTLALVSPFDLLVDLLGDAALPLRRVELDGKDPVFVCRFRGGGGLLTYAKHEGSDSARFVHTLNTESGLARKCEAVGIAPSLIFRATSGRDFLNFTAVLAVTAFLDDPDTNACAYALVRRFRRV